jgi:prolipoprotein diacylglyceryltransferase
VILRVNGEAVQNARQIHRLWHEAPSGAPLRITVQRTDLTVLPRTTEERDLVFDLPRSVPLHPSQIYSAIDASLLFLLAWLYYPLRRREGQVLALVMFVHGFSRFFLEKLRMDNPALAWGLTVSQWISLGLIAAGTVLYLALWRWGRPVAGPPALLVTHP